MSYEATSIGSFIKSPWPSIRRGFVPFGLTIELPDGRQDSEL